ncbi:class III lanthionine synthetase LanKC [Micromonospora sp. NPDC023956]|uniref:class III lanthionine synthetase LanKC n=1 Tax=Micromonospora sp. NPDC023956 TaxID=3155722 RepID=UPI0033E46046
MDLRYHNYCLADPTFYDLPTARVAAVPGFGTGRSLPPGWGVRTRGPWTMVSPERPGLPAQGWKIHVSTTPADATDTLEVVWRHCVDRNVPFKHLADATTLMLSNMKYADRASSGKFITIYPRDTAELHELLVDLDRVLGGRPGPYILSDVRWNAGPLYVRYGGFAERYCRTEEGALVLALADPTGQLVPDRRQPSFRLPDWVAVPDFVERAITARTSPATPHELPYRIERPLHYSNGGGVYLATDPVDERPVVLKEARPGAGVDGTGQDAVQRLRHEREFLQKLADTGVVPRVLGDFVCWEHHFLAEEYLSGETLGRAMVQRNPLVRADAGRAEIEAYTEWALSTLDRVEERLRTVHEHGYVFGDLHPHNVVLTDDGDVRFIDLELASHAADEKPLVLGAPGFLPPDGRVGVEADRYAMACLRVFMFLPLTILLPLAPAKLPMLLASLAQSFPVPREFVDRLAETLRDRRPAGGGGDRVAALTAAVDAGTADRGEVRRSMRDAILASATPHRTDRLFPGDIDQFTHGGLGIAHGAAGVLGALAHTGSGRFPEHESWLVDAVRQGRDVVSGNGVRPVGLFDGLHGVACVLAELGRPDDAANVLDRVLDTPVDALSHDLLDGLAGVGVSLLRLAGITGGSTLRERAVSIGDRLAEHLRTRPASTSVANRLHQGLLRGPSGHALFFVRLFEATGDPGFLDQAATLLRRDLAACVPTPDDGLQMNEGWRTLPYLASGSAGVGMVVHRFLRHRTDEEFTDALGRIRRAAEAEFVIGSGLFNGRAGLVTFLAATTTGAAGDARSDGRIDRHLRRFAWHMMPYRNEVAFPGDQLLRLSTDLATGSAGVLLALDARTRGTADDLFSFIGIR